MSAVFCSDSDDLNVGDQVICLKNGHWRVIPVQHWDKLSNTGTVYILDQADPICSYFRIS